MKRYASAIRSAGAFLAVFICVMMTPYPCAAQGYGSFFGLGSFEKYLGPIFPTGTISSSFRSEMGTGLATAVLAGAKLTGSNGREFDLIRYARLDENPQRLDIFANLRIWRLGAHANYWNFDTRSEFQNGGKIDLSGLIMGGDIDLVQLDWLAAGCRADVYFLDPRFQGTLRNPFENTVEGAQQGKTVATLNIKGDRPVTVGPYLRYVPPEIVGWPLHVEAFLKLPVKGSSLTSCGLGFVFRPQIYRFDMAARLSVENTWLKFSSGAIDFQPVASEPAQDWKLEAVWQLYGLDFAIYF